MSEPPSRSIVHLDADAFFASVEQSADPRLRGKPVAVGGEKRGIIASASYEARQFGIYTPMPTAVARRLCPKLILLPGDFEKYELFSRLMFSYAYDFTPDVEIGSIDEGYFDLSGARQPALSIAEKIRRAIGQSLRLSVSEGIGSNKLVSQIASKLKKPSSFEFVPRGAEAVFLAPLANGWLPGVGPKTASQLNAAGLARIGQIAATPAELLGLFVGSTAPILKRFALGIDERPVIPARQPAKSYGEQETFAADTTDEPFLAATLRRMADALMAKVRAEEKSIRTVTVKIRYNDMTEEQASESLREPTDLETEIYPIVEALLRKAWKRRVSLRLVSLKLSNLYEGPFRSVLALDASGQRRDAEQRLAGVVDNLRQKFGRGAILRGHDFVLRETKERKEEPVATEVQQIFCSDNANSDSRGSLGVHLSGCIVPPDTLKGGHRTRVVPRQPRILQRRSLPLFAPLRAHSYYSFLDSTLSVKALIELARRHGLPAIALTDAQNLHGVVEFFQVATEAGIKPIIGAEVNWQKRRLCLYVQNQTGYANLCRILNAINLFDSPASPGIPKTVAFEQLLVERNEGLIALSPHEEIAQHFPGRFYLETNSEEALERRSVSSLPCAAAFPVRYETPADRWKYNIVQSIRTLTLLRQAHPEKRLAGEYHFRSPEEMQRLFREHPELLAHSLELAERCSFQFALGKPQFPGYTPPSGISPAAFLRQLVMQGLRRRYPKDADRVRPQLEQELAIITEVGYEEYFLVMWDILQECRRRGIEWITRGSAADSLACYCLEISGVCPIRFDLYFRRFLNKDRMALNKLPDIDVDFAHDRKDDVIDLIFEKSGALQTAVVGGFSTFQSRSAFAEVAKVLGVSDFQARRITERLPHFSHARDLSEVVSESIECRDLPLDQEPYSTALKMASFLDGFPRYPKMHPCGVVLSRQPMEEIVPCFRSAKGYPTTHFDMDSVEAVGLIKMDILAQGGLAVMRDVKAMLQAKPHPALLALDQAGQPSPSSMPENSPPDLEALEPWKDPNVWELIASGDARAVHHIESPAMISLCKMCNVRDIDTLVAIVSVIRPGAANESKKLEFARRYQGASPVQYPHPSLEACLRSTYGLVVYEEHILQICEAFAGLPPGRADVLRRALGKEKEELIQQIAVEFAACARRLGRSENDIVAVWNLVAGFRGYAFCKAHSTAYGVEAYQSAWLKRYFPVEFMAAVLTNGKGFYRPLVYILECHRLGIPLLPPCINEPGPQFTVTAGKIRVPALLIKGLTNRTIDRWKLERERSAFISLTDFQLRVQPLPEEMQALIQVGAFDCFERDRTTQFWEFKLLSQTIETAPARRSQGSGMGHQLWLLPPVSPEHVSSAPLTEPNRLQRLRWEEEALGYCVSGHPLELYPDIAWDSYCPVKHLGNHIGEQIVTCGLVIEQRLFHQVTGEPMKFLTIADWTGIVETELFARTYKSYGLNTVRYRVLEITATVEPFENSRGYTLRVLRAGQPRKAQAKASTKRIREKGDQKWDWQNSPTSGMLRHGS